MTFELGLILLKRFGQLLIIGLILSAYLYEKHAHKLAVQEMTVFKQQLHDADIAKQAENALKLKIAQKTIEDSAKVHADEQAQILSQYAIQISKGKIQNETATKQLNTANANLDQLRRAVADSLKPMPARGKTASDTAEAWRVDNTTLSAKLTTCESAAAIATSDYNALYKHDAANCELTGCN